MTLNNSSFFQKYSIFLFPSKGGWGERRKCGHVDDEEKRLRCFTHKACHEFQTGKDPNSTESEPPETKKGEEGEGRNKEKQNNPAVRLTVGVQHVFKDGLDPLFRVVLRCIFKFLLC